MLSFRPYIEKKHFVRLESTRSLEQRQQRHCVLVLLELAEDINQIN